MTWQREVEEVDAGGVDNDDEDMKSTTCVDMEIAASERTADEDSKCLLQVEVNHSEY